MPYGPTLCYTHSRLSLSLHTYLYPDFTIPTSDMENTKHHAVHWWKANLFVCSVLTVAIMEEKQHDIGHLPMAAEIWMEACHLYIDSMVTDWTSIIMVLMTTCYNNGKDVTVHITKMKTYCHDLLFMQHDIDDELFTCFLCIFMPSSWNYVFTALLEHYTSAKVEWHIWDEYRVHMSQSNTSLQVVCPKKKCYCDNCKLPSHWTKDCWAPGGPMHGKPGELKLKKIDEGTKDKDKQTEKSVQDAEGNAKFKQVNQAIVEDVDHKSDQKASDSDLLVYLVAQMMSCSHFSWILDSRSTNHICTEWSAFTIFTLTNSIIKGIVKNGLMLQVLSIRTILVTVSVKGREDWMIKLLDVSYCPNAHNNLMSESQMDCHGMEITKWNGQKGKTIMKGCLWGNLYEINTIITPPTTCYNTAFSAHTPPNLDLWHVQLDNISLKSRCYLKHHQLITGLNLCGNPCTLQWLCKRQTPSSAISHHYH